MSKKPTATAMSKSERALQLVHWIMRETGREAHCRARIADFGGKTRERLEDSFASLYERERRSQGLLLMGPPDAGKTHALYALRNEMVIKATMQDLQEQLSREEIISNCGPVLGTFRLVTHMGLIAQLRKNPDIITSTTHDDTMQRTILFVDDFGRAYEDKSGWNSCLEFEFFDYRWRCGLPTFITTNMTPKELRAWEGRDALADRMGDPVWMKAVAMPPGQWRKGNRK
ncbi:MAG TPA: hypothetical protein VFI02_14165 [Armatimonadota bacterium]|nr:hypothetical protein [Armatimonadota bacterium]